MLGRPGDDAAIEDLGLAASWRASFRTLCSPRWPWIENVPSDAVRAVVRAKRDRLAVRVQTRQDIEAPHHARQTDPDVLAAHMLTRAHAAKIMGSQCQRIANDESKLG